MEIQQAKKDLVGRLRKVKTENGLTINGIMERLEENNTYLSESTVKRMFSDNVDPQGFKYSTLVSVADVLLDLYKDDSGLDDTEALKAIIREKNRTISVLIGRDEERKADYDRRVSHLQKQIERLDEHLMFREEIINKLLDKVIKE